MKLLSENQIKAVAGAAVQSGIDDEGKAYITLSGNSTYESIADLSSFQITKDALIIDGIDHPEVFGQDGCELGSYRFFGYKNSDGSTKYTIL